MTEGQRTAAPARRRSSASPEQTTNSFVYPAMRLPLALLLTFTDGALVMRQTGVDLRGERVR